ncbi:interferon-gamma-inducible GTPase 10-like [Ruditapes philippinarum]|uniref:interferon-gamma-inducible GTPase 10-like n=1 Tax=Ruditapes philippinarum TaxID=129788 RepID=UPI00295BD7DE|nr:interferon-gamma-inducible GTPase 10-like [Ruditapes philippinarum]
MAQGSGTSLKELTSKSIVSFADTYTRNGIKGLTDAITDNLDAWRNTDINIALAGKAGAGKSTFINAIRGLDGDSPGAAPTGTIETTTEITPYKHPLNPKLVLIDLPGVGTNLFPKETYKQEIDFQMFDFLIIVSEKRFSENDIWLAKEIEKIKKKFYFVRTKFGSDLKNEERKRNRNLTSEEKILVKQTIRDDIEVNLKTVNCKKNLFIIDSFERGQFDFPGLEEMLKNDTVKREAMILTLQAVTEQAINEKKTVLEGRIWKIATRAAFAPRVNDADIAILKNEKEFYLTQFSLDEESLRHDAQVSNIEDDQLAELFKNKNTEEDKKREQSYVDEFEKIFPFLPIRNHIKTYRLGKQFLQDTLNSVVERAIEVNRTLASGIAEKCTD